MPLRIILSCLLLLAMAASACSKREPAEERIRALIASAEQAIEKKEIGPVRRQISERYSDNDGHDRRSVEGMLRLHVLRNESVHLLTRISSITLPAPDRAEAVVYVAMAVRPVSDAEQLAAMNASLYRFELTFADEDGEWRLTRAAWRRAEANDFVYQ